MAHHKLSTLNLGNILVVASLGGLGAAFYLPYATASRVTRIERRASSNAAALFAVAAELTAESIDFGDADQAVELLAAANARAGNTDPESSLFLRASPAPVGLGKACFCVIGKHYLYMVTKTPDSVLGDGGYVKRPAGKDGKAPSPVPVRTTPHEVLEVYAWPRKTGEGSLTVFFWTTGATAAFSRNLEGQYSGLEQPPLPGAGREKQNTDGNTYRGTDEEHWLRLRRPI